MESPTRSIATRRALVGCVLVGAFSAASVSLGQAVPQLAAAGDLRLGRRRISTGVHLLERTIGSLTTETHFRTIRISIIFTSRCASCSGSVVVTARRRLEASMRDFECTLSGLRPHSIGSTRRNGGGRLRCIIRKVRMSVISGCEHEQPNPPLEPIARSTDAHFTL